MKINKIEYNKLECKEPFISNKNPKILILGTVPSDASIGESNFYYSGSNNSFWKIISALFNESIPLSIEDKKALLKKYDISLWDVYKKVDRQKNFSVDKKMKNKVPNDEILTIFNPEYIFCNGKEAQEVFKKLYPDVTSIQLLSSSNATRKWKLPITKFYGWEKIKDCYK